MNTKETRQGAILEHFSDRGCDSPSTPPKLFAVVKDVPIGTVSRKIDDVFVDDMVPCVGRTLQFESVKSFSSGAIQEWMFQDIDVNFNYCEDWLHFCVFSMMYDALNKA